MSVLKNKKFFTITGLGLAMLIAIYISLTVEFNALVPSGGSLANYIIVVIAGRAVLLVTLIWFFYESALELISKHLSGKDYVKRYRDKKIKIITWYLVFEILMLITFI